MEKIDNTGKLVCVTGASGFIASHIVCELLQRGYRVRATVRNTNDKSKTDHLRKFAEDGQLLELVNADLLEEGSFDAAVAGCDYVCHVASRVVLTAKDPQTEIVDVAVNGTKNVLAACAKTDTIKRLVLTSSIAAVIGEQKGKEYTYTEDDWNEDATLKGNPYSLAKVLAEKVAWDLQDSLPFDIVAINPSLVLGPVYTEAHSKASPSVIRQMLSGKLPACPALCFGIVDVREVATAHVNALEIPSTSGRYILYNEGCWMQEMAQIVKANFPKYKVATKRLANWLVYIFVLFDKSLTFSFLRKNLGIKSRVNASKSQQQLGIRYRPVEETIVATCRSFIDRGFVKRITD